MIDVLQNILAFIVAIGLLVTIHEFGHYWVARRMGVKVLRFSIGFGRPLFTRRAGPDQTEYVLAAIPLGGYVKMLDEREGAVDARERDRAFNAKSLGARIAIVVAGPGANFIFAVFAYWLMFVIGVNGLKAIVGEVSPDSIAARAGLMPGMAITQVEGRDVRTWEGVVQAVITETLDSSRVLSVKAVTESGETRTVPLDFSQLILDDLTQGQFFTVVGVEPGRPAIPARIGELTPGAVAAKAGLQSADLVLEANGEPIKDWSALVDFVRARPEQPISLLINRGGQHRNIDLIPARLETESGAIGRIGAGPFRDEALYNAYYVTETYSPWRSVQMGITKTYEVSALTLGVFWKMLTFEVSLKNLSGPISIAQYAGYSADNGLARFLEFLAIVSVSLGILNLLPIPVLDGGHLLYYIVEFVKGGPVSEQSQILGQQVGIAVLVGLMSLAFYNDIARLLG